MSLVDYMPACATHAAYIVSNPDATDCEFLSLNLDAVNKREELRTRWAGRNLQGAGLAFIERGTPRLILKQEPSDFIAVLRLTAAYVQYVEELRQAGDFIEFATRLWSLEDNRPEA